MKSFKSDQRKNMSFQEKCLLKNIIHCRVIGYSFYVSVHELCTNTFD